MSIKNILVIRAYRLGDILQLTPMFDGLKEQYPGCRIYFLTEEEYAPLISGNPRIDNIITITEKENRYIMKNKPEYYPRLFNDFYDLIAQLKEIKFDLIINRQFEFGAALACLVGAPLILGGAYTPQKGFYFNDRFSGELFDIVRSNRRMNKRNLVDWSCLIAGIKRDFIREISFPVPVSACNEARELLAGKPREDGLIGVQMGASKSFRQWGVDNFLPVLKWLTEKQGKKIILTGSEDEKEEAAIAVQTLGQDACLDLTGKTSLPVLASVISQCELLLTPDTGTMHIAAAVKTPVLAFFYGGAYPWETGPYGQGHFILWPDLPCAPCRNPQSCGNNHQCRNIFSPDIAIRALAEIFSARNSGEINWDSGNKIKLLYTETENDEQSLTAVSGRTKLPSKVMNLHSDLKINIPSNESLLAESNELADELLEGNDKTFMHFSNFFSNFSLYRTETAGCGFPEIPNGLYSLVNRALVNRDFIMLRDILKNEIYSLLNTNRKNQRTSRDLKRNAGNG